ncbi:hypothetical protein pVco7_gp002 [Vibrio phage pVco-7]|uniref:Uncharacterized protein n=1 Tax=Vibrio phage pVco-5 TaxID=1965485 RepID=A0A1W6JUP4_9CAUD|nr:hypothetical protein KNT61_gp003 [Vibrio phage pVco-5]ARM70991.1 hypothetical protein pVco5_003 [Vibrio phage pVco-5]
MLITHTYVDIKDYRRGQTEVWINYKGMEVMLHSPKNALFNLVSSEWDNDISNGKLTKYKDRPEI